MYSNRSIALHRVAVMAVALAAFVVAFAQARALWEVRRLWELGEPIAFGVSSGEVTAGRFSEAYALLAMCGVAGVLALYMAWKFARRGDARFASLSTACLGPRPSRSSSLSCWRGFLASCFLALVQMSCSGIST